MHLIGIMFGLIKFNIFSIFKIYTGAKKTIVVPPPREKPLEWSIGQSSRALICTVLICMLPNVLVTWRTQYYSSMSNIYIKVIIQNIIMCQ